MLQDRRQFQRFIPDSSPAVCLGESWTGCLFDLSEGGLSIHGLLPTTRDQTIPVNFNLPGGNIHIQARAEFVWTNESLDRTGFRLFDLAETSRQQLRKWVSARVHTPALATDLVADEPKEVPSETITAASGFPSSPIAHDWGDRVLGDLRTSLAQRRAARGFQLKDLNLVATGPFRRLSRLCPPVGLMLILVLVSPVSFFLGHALANRGNQPRAIYAAHTQPFATSVPEFKPAAAVSPTVTAPSHPAPLPFDFPGFVLQVGAMTQETNADVLRQSLEKRNFPVFVFKHEKGRFYRVAVGPYSDPATALAIKDQLEAEGFAAFIKPWSPE